MFVQLLGGAIASGVTAYLGIKWLAPWLLVDFKYLWRILPALKKFTNIVKRKVLLIDLFEENVKKNPDKTFLLYEDEKYTYKEVDERANQVGRLMLSLGKKKHDTVALIQYNCPEFVWTYIGLMKVGIRIAMINTNLRGKTLSHCIEVSETDTILVANSSDLISAVDNILPNFPSVSVYVLSTPSTKLPDRFTCLQDNLSKMDSSSIGHGARQGIVGSDHLVYIYTSGTTGLPKAAVVTQRKIIAGYVVALMAGIGPNDIIYSALPLYHSSALVIGLGSTMMTNATFAIAKKFSKSNFFNDIRKHNATVMVYIGELCRYLLTNEKNDLDRQHKLRVALGNGLRYDIFEEFRTRYAIPNVVEFYASTEGNTGFANIFNVIGSCGRSSPFLQMFLQCGLFQWDVENECLARDSNGLCIPVKRGTPGLLLIQVNKLQIFDGYKGNKKLTNSKIACDVRKKGDQYFNTGDLMSVDDLYFLYFKDRVGDTFRWKGENVSTTEVSNLLTDVPFIVDACVYGVEIPGCDGKAGMATLLIDPKCQPVTSVELKAVSDHCQEALPVYAIPMFLRLKWEELDMTSTIKQSKVRLKQEGFDYTLTSDPVYYYDKSDKLYKLVTKETYEGINSRRILF